MYIRIVNNETTILINENASIEIISNDRYMITGEIEAINISGKIMPTKSVEKIILPINNTMLFYIIETIKKEFETEHY